jgi:HIV Tat-specific factor 1
MPVPTANGHGAPTAAPPGADERMYFSREAGTWRFEDDDGNEMEYDASKAAWVPVVSLRRSAQANLI